MAKGEGAGGTGRASRTGTAGRAGAAVRAGTLLPASPSRRSDRNIQLIDASASRPEQIRAAGCHLMFLHGYAGMTMRQIAALLQIKAASLYYHFPSKQEILFDLMQATAAELLRGLREILASGEPPEAQLEQAIRWHVLFHTRKREEAFISHSELRSLTPENLETILKLRREYEKIFDSILRSCQRADGFTGEKPAVIRNSILTMCTATAGWFSPGGELTAEQVAEKLWQFVRHGVFPQRAVKDHSAA